MYRNLAVRRLMAAGAAASMLGAGAAACTKSKAAPVLASPSASAVNDGVLHPAFYAAVSATCVTVEKETAPFTAKISASTSGKPLSDAETLAALRGIDAAFAKQAKALRALTPPATIATEYKLRVIDSFAAIEYELDLAVKAAELAAKGSSYSKTAGYDGKAEIAKAQKAAQAKKTVQAFYTEHGLSACLSG